MVERTLGHVIHEIRLNHGMTQDQLAKATGVSGRPVVSYWEADKSKPNPNALKRLADLEGIKVVELLSRADAPLNDTHTKQLKGDD